MRPRTLTLASFFSIAMAATLIGALVTSQGRRLEPSVASTKVQPPLAPGSALGLETFRDIARAVNPGVVNINTSKLVKRPAGGDIFNDEMMERFFGQPAPDRGPAPEGRQGGRERRQTQYSLGTSLCTLDTQSVSQ